MGSVTFRNEVDVWPSIAPELECPLEIRDLSFERSIQSASPEWVLRNGTPLIVRILRAILEVALHYEALPIGYHQVVDARVQRLMPGQFPSIPGWHGDAVPRADFHGQPDLGELDRLDVRHYAMLCGTDDEVSNTEFVDNHPTTLSIDDEGPSVWQQVHRALESEKPPTFELPNGQVAAFACDSLHRARPVRTRGWRAFVRLAAMRNPPLENGFAGQQQVYVLSEANGW